MGGETALRASEDAQLGKLSEVQDKTGRNSNTAQNWKSLGEQGHGEKNLFYKGRRSRETLISVPLISSCHKFNFNFFEKVHLALAGVLLNLSWKPFSIFSAFILKKRCRQIHSKTLTNLNAVKNMYVE